MKGEGTHELRFTWEPKPGHRHPKHTHDRRFVSREHAERVAHTRWERDEAGAVMTAVEIRDLPDGAWEPLLPVEAPCEVRPGGYIGQEAAAP